MNSIKTTLEMWGNWARCNVGTEYSKVNVTFQAALPESGPLLFRTDDEQGMVVDSAVAGLRHYDQLAYKLVIAHYVYRISQSKLAKQIGKAQSYIAGLLRIAVAFIAGQIFVQTGEAISV